MEKIYGRRSRRKVALAFAMLASSVVAIAATSSTHVSVASAADPISVTTVKRARSYTTDRTEWLPAFKVKNSTPYNLAVVVSFASAPKGTQFSIGSNSGLTLKYGFSRWKKVSTISFTGPTNYVNAALASMKLHTRGTGKVVMKVSATSDDTSYAYEALSGHYYGFISAPGITWTDALAAASQLSFRDTPAYLAAITSADENDFVTYNVKDAANAWIGATDKDAEGEFKWATGEVAGTTFWKAACSGGTGADSCEGANNVLTGSWANTYLAAVSDKPVVNTYSSWDLTSANTNPTFNYHEPNNWGGGEDYVATNWKGTDGLWNDLPNDAGMQNGKKVINGYIVEFAGPKGQPFKGVVEATNTFTVKPSPSEYAPSKVNVVKDSISLGSIRVDWKKPTKTSASGLGKLLRGVKLEKTYVTVSSRPNEVYCEKAGTLSSASCRIDGFVPGDEIVVTVHAKFNKPPMGNGLFKRGQTVFASSAEVDKFDFAMPAGLSTAIGRQVRTGATVSVVVKGLQPSSAYKVTTSDGVVVAVGNADSSGNVPSGTKFNFPVSELSESGAWWTNFRKAVYVFTGVNADGSALEQQVTCTFSGLFYTGSYYGKFVSPWFDSMQNIKHVPVVG